MKTEITIETKQGTVTRLQFTSRSLGIVLEEFLSQTMQDMNYSNWPDFEKDLKQITIKNLLS